MSLFPGQGAALPFFYNGERKTRARWPAEFLKRLIPRAPTLNCTVSCWNKCDSSFLLRRLPLFLEISRGCRDLRFLFFFFFFYLNVKNDQRRSLLSAPVLWYLMINCLFATGVKWKKKKTQAFVLTLWYLTDSCVTARQSWINRWLESVDLTLAIIPWMCWRLQRLYGHCHFLFLPFVFVLFFSCFVRFNASVVILIYSQV